jgi:uncharacterized protein YndB with AHSA1/START domain
MTRTGEKLALDMTLTFDAPPAKVFAALTRPEQIAKWYGPSDDYTVAVKEWDLKVGGKYRISLTHKDGNVHTVHGTFREITEPETVSYTWSWEDQPPMDSVVTFRLREAAGQTELAFTHEGFGDAESRDRHRMGWTGSLERLARAVS